MATLIVVESEAKGREIIEQRVADIAVWGDNQETDVLFAEASMYDIMSQAHPYLVAPLTRGKGDLEHPLYDDPVELIVQIFEATNLITVVE